MTIRTYFTIKGEKFFVQFLLIVLYATVHCFINTKLHIYLSHDSYIHTFCYGTLIFFLHGNFHFEREITSSWMQSNTCYRVGSQKSVNFVLWLEVLKSDVELVEGSKGEREKNVSQS
uniref:Uncharacterized protein n=1 Tax=Cacopsylla melanoneura TaxID=428564 RepID=A0A8D9E8K6_9HEMI